MPGTKFKRDLLISEHSPIRLLEVDWSWRKIESWITVHFARHKWEKFISTRRTDRTGIDRKVLRQDEPVDMDGFANAQNLIDTARKRLCYQASRETREYMRDLKCAIHDTEPELADVLVPNCIYRGGCPEFHPCGYWNIFRKRHALDTDIGDIRQRYDAYNSEVRDIGK